MENYPEDVKRYIGDYNKGIEIQDIMEVNLAIDGLVQLVFHSDKNIRDWAGIVVQKIAQIQPGFIKKGMDILLHRYKGSDVEKSEDASIVIGLITETPAKNLITDPEILKKVLIEHNERLSKQRFEDEKKKEFLEKVKAKQIKYIGISGEFLQLGQFYSKLIIDEDSAGAQKVVDDLIFKTLDFYGIEEKKEDFEMGCLLLSVICSRENREPFIPNIIGNMINNFEASKKKQREAYQEILISIIKSIQDLIPPKYAAEIVSIANKRIEDKKKEGLEKFKQLQQVQRMAININVTWEKAIKELATVYNESLKNNDEKTISKTIEALKPNLFSKDPYVLKSSLEMFSQILEKNFSLFEDFIQRLIRDYKKQEVSLVLGENIALLDQKGVLEKGIKNFLNQDKENRTAKEKEEKEKIQKENQRIEALKVEFSGEWDKRLLAIIEPINNHFINNKIKDAEKLVLGSMKNYIYAENKEISKQAITFLNNVGKKYPAIIVKLMKELIDLFKSDHEMRVMAVDFLGFLNENPNRSIFFKDIEPALLTKLKEDTEKRTEEVKKTEELTKWDAIKLDVTTLIINLEYDKKLQKICRAYNEAIKIKNTKEVIENVQEVVDWFLTEKNEEKLNQVIEVIGKIAKQNIELIVPAIEMFMKMVDNKDEDTKFRAIKGLGEVSYQRPGWAYQGLEKLVQISRTDENENARMKALLELSRIGKSNPTMLVEHIDAIISALKDPNKHVRRLAAYTIGSMAEAIPLEAEEAIPALVDALHDEYFLVRQFADKALTLIRAAMRKK